MSVIATLNTVFSADTNAFDNAIKSSRKGLSGFQSSIMSVKSGLLSLGAGLSVVGAAKWSIGLAAEMEQIETSFAVMLGSAEKADTLLNDLNQFAAVTPFETTELADATKKLLAFGVAQDDVIPNMTKLGDIAAGLGIPISELAELFGKARVQGTLMSEDINQLTGRGIPVIAQFAKQFGIAEGEVKKLASTGKITFANLETAIESLTAQGSIFGGGMEKQSKTLAGQWSTLKDDINKIGIDFGTAILPALKEMVPLTSKIVSNIKDAVGPGAYPLSAQAMPAAQIQSEIDRLLAQRDAAQLKIDQGIGGGVGVTSRKFEIAEIMRVVSDLKAQLTTAQLNEQAAQATAAIEGIPSAAASAMATAVAPASAAIEATASAAVAATKEVDAAAAKTAATWDKMQKSVTSSFSGFEKFGRAMARGVQERIRDQTTEIIEATRTPMEEFEKRMKDLQSLQDVGAFAGATEAFERAKLSALQDLDRATAQSAPANKNAALERGTAAAFAAEREKDSPVKTQKEILEQAKQQTALQQQQLEAFKSGGVVAVNF